VTHLQRSIDTIEILIAGYKEIKCLWGPKNAFYKSHLKENNALEQSGYLRICVQVARHRKSRKSWIHCHCSGISSKKGTAEKLEAYIEPTP
jgi:hypothetical protein